MLKRTKTPLVFDLIIHIKDEGQFNERENIHLSSIHTGTSQTNEEKQIVISLWQRNMKPKKKKQNVYFHFICRFKSGYSKRSKCFKLFSWSYRSSNLNWCLQVDGMGFHSEGIPVISVKGRGTIMNNATFYLPPIYGKNVFNRVFQALINETHTLLTNGWPSSSRIYENMSFVIFTSSFLKIIYSNNLCRDR